MIFKVLVDNSAGTDPRLEPEHGLSFWFQLDGQQWLLDVGASGKFADNAAGMGISIAEVDHLLLSHAHADHTGGLEVFLQLNDHADIWLSSRIDGRHHYSTRRGACRDISIDYHLLEAYPERFHFVGELRELSASLTLMTDIPAVYPLPKANETLFVSTGAAATSALQPDDFSHEMAVVVREKEGTTVLSSCSHKGLLNTLHAAGQLYGKDSLKAYIGGLHLVDSDATHRFESENELVALAEQLCRDYPDLKIFTGHCTGEHAVNILGRELGDAFEKFHTGASADSLARTH